MLKITVRNTIKFPEITLQEDLEKIAQNIIIPDIIRGIDNSMAISGGALPANEPATIIRKGHDRQLVETGLLRSSFYWKSQGKNKVKISINVVRKKIGGYLQDGIMTKKGLKQYLFFGISKDANDGAMRYIKNRIEGLISGK